MTLESNLHTAVAMQQRGLHHEAKLIYEAILLRFPKNVDALHLLGVVHLETGDVHRAEALVSKAIALKKTRAEFHCNYGLVLRKLGRIADSLRAFEAAIRIRPNYAAAQLNRGVALQDLGRYDEALDSFNRAINLQPSAVGYSNRGILMRLLRNPTAALEDFRTASALDPNYVESHWSMSLALLDIGRFQEGWEKYEWRLRNPELTPRLLKTSAKRWSPDASVNRLLVYAEQGIGDQIFFCTALQSVAALAPEVLVLCDDRVVSLLKRSYPQFEVYGQSSRLSELTFDAYLELGSLFWALESRGIATSDVRKGGYLTADHELSRELRTELASNGGMVCGISWRSQNAPHSFEKSMRLIDFEPLMRSRDAVFVSLQYGDVSGEISSFRSQTGLQIFEVNHIDNFSNLDGHAALINACDTVISVSNATAHLAGALGSMGHVVIPAARGIFSYWMPREMGRSYWYPSLCVYDQKRGDDWCSVVAEIIKNNCSH